MEKIFYHVDIDLDVPEQLKPDIKGVVRRAVANLEYGLDVFTAIESVDCSSLNGRTRRAYLMPMTSYDGLTVRGFSLYRGTGESKSELANARFDRPLNAF